MKLKQIFFLSLALFAVCTSQKSSGGASIESIKTIAIYNQSESNQIIKQFVSPFGDTLTLDLPFGTVPNDLVLSLVKNKSTKVMVENRYITSMAISDEGAHLDLLSWKHFESDWMPVQSNELGYTIGAYSGDFDSEKFPTVNQSEIISAIPESAKQRWQELAVQCTTAQSQPCYVSISQYLIRISTGDSSSIFIRINVPMGC